MRDRLVLPLKAISTLLWPHNCFFNFSQLAALKRVSSHIRLYSPAPKRVTATSPDRLAEILEIPLVSAERILIKTKGNVVNDQNVSVVFNILKKYGFSANSVIQQPMLLNFSPVVIENYILCMKESGFYEIQPQMIYRYPHFSKRSILMLKSCKTIPNQDEIVKQYCEILELRSEMEERIWTALPNNVDKISLNELRQTVMAQYFADRLDTTPVLAKTIMETYPRVYYRCFEWIKETLDVLLNTVELSKSMVKKHGYLLQSNPKNVSDIMNQIDHLSGIDIRTFVQMRPKVLMTQCSSLLEIRSLFENTISNEAIAKYPAVYTLSPVTIKERLEELKSIPEFAALQQHPRIARLIYYQKKVKTRLEYLTSNKMIGASLHILSTDGKRFEKFVSMGEMKTKGSDVIQYLADYFNIHKSIVRKKLMLHNHWLQVPLLTVEDSLRHLESLNVFSKSAIFDCVHILLYPKAKIKKEMDYVLETNESSLNDNYLLHMVMYFMERHVHFTGDGLWEHRSQDDEEEFGKQSKEKSDTSPISNGGSQETNPLRLMPNQ